MYFLFLGFGILAVSVAFEQSKKLGAMLLAIVILSLLLTAQKKGIVS
jgi:hypothetical protein